MQLSLVDQGNRIPQVPRLRKIVRHMDRGQPLSRVERLQFTAQPSRRPAIQRTQRLIEQQNFRLGDQCPAQRDPLLFTATQCALVTREQVVHAKQPCSLPHFPLALRFPVRTVAQAKLQILFHRQMREQQVVLVHHPDPAPFGRLTGHIPSADPNAAAVRLINAQQEFQEQRLPRPGGAHDRQILPRLHFECDVANREIRPPPADCVEADHTPAFRTLVIARSATKTLRATTSSSAASGLAFS